MTEQEFWEAKADAAIAAARADAALSICEALIDYLHANAVIAKDFEDFASDARESAIESEDPARKIATMHIAGRTQDSHLIGDALNRFMAELETTPALYAELIEKLKADHQRTE